MYRGWVYVRCKVVGMPAAVADKVDEGDKDITNATGHSSDRMVRQVYDRRKTKAAKVTQ